MHVINANLLDQVQGPLKFILNEGGIVFFPAQLRDARAANCTLQACQRFVTP